MEAKLTQIKNKNPVRNGVFVYLFECTLCFLLRKEKIRSSLQSAEDGRPSTVDMLKTLQSILL